MIEQIKFALGPYEVFASIVGGSPLVLAIFLVFNPSASPQDVFFIIKNDLSLSVIVLLIFFSYVIGGSIQGFTWRYFLFLCGLFHRDHGDHFGNMILEKINLMNVNKELGEVQIASELEFEDRLVLLLREKVGIPKKMSWLTARLSVYLKECGSQAVIAAESYQANHIMYRNMSFGFLLLSVVILFNLIWTRSFDFERPVILLLFLFLSYITFFRSVSFKRWHSRELLLAFYFSASNGVK